MTRQRFAALAAGLLLVLVVASQPLAELPRRIRTLVAFAPKELAVRRLGGSGTAFDRRFFSFLENARRRMPSSAKGVVILGVPWSVPVIYLASYHFAPLPVSFGYDRVPGALPVPSGWVVARYGEMPTPAGPVITLPEGALWGPVP
ncbi:MAG TPA: hypothetical protein VN032_09910 [Thermoanaerobaculia bacterium]|nr:hypothetical protein [Thermoanaerobaculia bacterium]